MPRNKSALGFALYDLPANGIEKQVTDDWILTNVPWGQQTNLVLKR